MNEWQHPRLNMYVPQAVYTQPLASLAGNWTAFHRVQNHLSQVVLSSADNASSLALGLVQTATWITKIAHDKWDNHHRAFS